MLQPGDRVAATYEIIRYLQSGGMSEVYEARNVWTQRPVAIKVLPATELPDPEASRRFLREAKLSARLTHPNIVRVLDMGMDADGFLFMVHELVQGESLEARIRRGGKLPVAAVLKLTLPVMQALIVAHAQGIVHRDVKPGNILLAQKAADYIVPQLTDFGLAKPMQAGDELAITTAGKRVGTPRYMSPEQLRAAAELDGRTDVWSMGVTIYEALTARLPFDGQSVAEIVLGILRSTISPPSAHAKRIPPELDAVVMKALSRRRSGRYQTMREMHDALFELAALAQSGTPMSGQRAMAAPMSSHEATSASETRAPQDALGEQEGTGDTTRIVRMFSMTRPLRAGVVATLQAVASSEFDEAFAKALGFRCDVLRYFNYAELVGALAEREVELAWLPPVAYVRARQAGVTRPLVTVERAGRADFCAALLGRKGIVDTWEAMQGRRAVWVDPWSAAGYLVPRWMMRARGQKPDQQFASQGFLGSHHAVLDALRAGTADVGATFCSVDASGAVIECPWSDLDPITLIAVSDPIPGDTICAAGDLSEELVRVLVASLGKCTATHPLLRALGATSLAPLDPSRYGAFEIALKAEANETRRAVRE